MEKPRVENPWKPKVAKQNETWDNLRSFSDSDRRDEAPAPEVEPAGEGGGPGVSFGGSN